MHTGKLSRKNYFLPSTADDGVRELYSFLAKYSPGGIDFYKDALPKGKGGSYHPREVVLDRYEQHTKHCKACSVRSHSTRSVACMHSHSAVLALRELLQWALCFMYSFGG